MIKENRKKTAVFALILANAFYVCFISIGTAHWEQWLKDNHQMQFYPFMAPAEVLGRMLASLFSGQLNEKFGFRNTLLLGCVLDILGSSIISLPIALDDPSYSFLFCFGRLLDGITYPFFVVTAFNFISSIFPDPTESKKYFAIMNFLFMIGYSTGILIGGFVQSPLKAASIMIFGPFFIIIMLLYTLPRAIYPKTESKENEMLESKEFIHKIWILLFIFAMYASAWPILFQIPYFARNINLEGHKSMMLLQTYPIGGFIGSIIPFSQTLFNEVSLLLLSCITILSLCLMAFWESRLTYFAALIVFFTVYTVHEVASLVVRSRVLNPHEMGYIESLTAMIEIGFTFVVYYGFVEYNPYGILFIALCNLVYLLFSLYSRSLSLGQRFETSPEIEIIQDVTLNCKNRQDEKMKEANKILE